MSRKLLIDYDVVAYAAAAVCQKTSYIYNDEEFATKTELKKRFPNYDTGELRAFTQVEPASHAVQCGRVMVDSILTACAPISEFKGYLTGSGNFRYELATIQPYKANREKLERPVHWQTVRDFLLRECNAEMVEGIEADDKLVIEWGRNPQNTVVATIDKDLSTVPGITLYNWKHKTLTTISTEEANLNFYKQILTGDTIDNIPGVKGLGPAKADKLLRLGMPEPLMITVCYTEYLKAYGREKAWDALVENGRLLHMIRNDAQASDPKTAWQPCHKPDGVL